MRPLAWCAILLLPVIVLGGLWAARRDPTKPNWILPTQMAVSPAYKTQSLNPVLPRGVTMQPPVAGTVARGERVFRYAATDAERQRAGRELTNSFKASAETLARGQQLYETFCLVCHGASGQGDGTVIPKFPNPPSFSTSKSKELSDGEMFHIITLGRNDMPSFAAQLSWEDCWQVITYIRSLQEGKP
jgi:mono/diheme cytochrome c family protein